MRKFVFDHPIISLCLVVNSGMMKLVADQQKQVFWLSLLPGGTKGRQVDAMTYNPIDGFLPKNVEMAELV